MVAPMRVDLRKLEPKVFATECFEWVLWNKKRYAGPRCGLHRPVHALEDLLRTACPGHRNLFGSRYDVADFLVPCHAGIFHFAFLNAFHLHALAMAVPDDLKFKFGA